MLLWLESQRVQTDKKVYSAVFNISPFPDLEAIEISRSKSIRDPSKMLLSDGNSVHQAEKSFRINQDDSFFSRLMSKESSIANPSSRISYYGEAPVAVPFLWESQPGTPKHPLSETSLPPLTPPPSYYSNSKSKTRRRNSKINILSSIFPRFSSSKKHNVSPSSSWSSNSCSSSSSSQSSTWSLTYSPPSFRSSSDSRQGSLKSPASSVGFYFKH